MAEVEDIESVCEGKVVSRQSAFVGALEQQRNIFKSYDPSECYKGGAVPVVQSSWSQIQGQLIEAVEAGQSKVLEKYQVVDKLSRLDNDKDLNGAPAWRPSQRLGDNIQAIVEASQRLCIPDYKAELAEIEKENKDFEAQLQEKQQELQELLAQEQQTMDSLNKMQSDFLTT